MTEPGFIPATDALDPRYAFDRRANWVRVRTMALLRWIAVSGQIAAVLVGHYVFGLTIWYGPVFAAIGAAAITNLMAITIWPNTRRLSETELAGTLVFDMVQLSALLALTGGLHNPFALLILAQVAISAAALGRRQTRIICTIAAGLITALLFVHLPLTNSRGEVLRLPDLFLLGFWAAILIGIVFQASYARRVTAEVTAMGDALAATQMALAREQKLTDLGGVVAAAAHELGTPLATIALVSAELVEEAGDDDTRADAQLIRDQAERCREILRGMGRAGKQDRHVRVAPLSSVIEEAAEPHADRGIDLRVTSRPEPDSVARAPSVARRPELIHGLRNLVQNGVDFARTTVWIDLRWNEHVVAVRIADDGPGYPSDTLSRLGDPFLRRRRETGPDAERPGYEGMGLGLFIAKTLLERSGAEVAFANGQDGFGPATEDRARCGALVTLTWSRAQIAVASDRDALGENDLTAN